jgi:hypothetical protein
MTIHIYQDGTDGFGHQLEGFFTCLILHGVNNYYFDGIEYIHKTFNFQHIKEDETIIMKEYLIEVAKQFVKDFNLSKINYKNIIRSHELRKIPKNYESNVLYSLDNIFFFTKIFKESNVIQKIHENIFRMKSYFINDKLPPNTLVEKNIVIHIRLGDALTSGRYDSIYAYNKKIQNLIDIFKIKYPDYTYYIHSDGFPINIINKIGTNYILFDKNTPLIQVLSDMIHANILICGNSSLSKVCSYFGEKHLVITHDDDNHCICNVNTYKISNYLQLQNNKKYKK